MWFRESQSTSGLTGHRHLWKREEVAEKNRAGSHCCYVQVREYRGAEVEVGRPVTAQTRLPAVGMVRSAWLLLDLF